MAVKGGKARKSKYDAYVKPYLEKVEQWCREGVTEADIAKRLGVSHNAWNDYKNKHPELKEAIRDGRASLVSDVTNSLIKRALGYEYTERKRVIGKVYDKNGNFIRNEVIQEQEVVKHVPAEVAAICALLRNYDRPHITQREEAWANSDQYCIENKKAEKALKKKELELKRRRLETEIAEEVKLDEEETEEK